MPAALPLIAGAFLAAGSVATAIGLGTAFVVAGLTITWAAALTITGVALMAVSYLARKTPKPDSAGSQLSQKLDPQAGVPVAFGRTATGGVITDRLTWGAKNAFYGIVTVLSAGGPIAGIEAYRAGDYPITFNTSPAYATASVTNVGGYSGNSKLYRGKLRQRWQNGDAPAMTTPAAASGFPMRGGALSGLAHVVTSYEYNADAFPQGLPTSVWTLRGVRLYDPRQDSTYPGGAGAHRVDQPATWTYSENPFLAALQWVLGRWENGHRVYGIGAKWSEVDVASFVNAANVADANGWKIGGVVSTLDDKYAVLASILAAGGGVPVARGAQIAVSVNAPKTSVLTLTAADIIGDVEMSSSTSFRDRQNTIIPRYREEAKKWEIISGERVSAAQYVTEDGGETKTVEIEFPLVQQAAQAHQLAAYELVNSREFLTFTVRAKQRLLAARVGDCINVTVPEIASRFTKCLVAGREFNPADMSVTLTLKSETDAKHAFALGQTQVAPPSAKLDGYDPSNPGAPAANAWAITDTTISNGTTTLPVIVVAGQTDDPNAATIIVEYRPTGSATWLNYGEFPRTTSRIEVSGLTDATVYDIALSYRTVRGVIGDRLVMSATAGAFKVSWDNSVAGPGKPADNADVTGQNTARDTANVGGRPSSQIVSGIDKLPDIRADIDKALAAGQAVADREQAAATPPGLVSNIQWSSVLTDAGADVTLTWTAAKDATSYEVELAENGGGGIVFAAPSTSYRFAAKRNTSYSARVRALKSNVASGWVSAPSFATGRDTVAPAAPTSLSATPGITWIDVATVAPADSDQAKVRFTLYRSSDNAKIGEATVSATANTRAETRFSNLTRAKAYYVSAVAIDSSDNVSAATANVSVATTGGVSLDDLTPGLVPPQTVTSLPAASGWTGSPVVFFAGELYRLSGGAWTKSVSGQDIAPSTISTDKLVNSAITADKLAAGSVTETRLADFSVANVKLAPGSVDQYKIIDGAVSGPKIATAAITEVKIANDAISAPKIQANAITADKIAANTIVARNLAIGNFDNIIPDGAMRDLGFWNGNTYNVSGGYGSGVSQIEVRDQNSNWRFGRTMNMLGPIDTYWFTPFFPVEIGATYKLDYQIYISPDFNGWLNISLHMPALYWYGIKSGIAGYAPDGNDTSGANTFHAGDTAQNPGPRIFTIPSEAQNRTKQTQFRFDGHWTKGYVEFMVSIVRVSDATLIKDGAITTDKITAGAVNTDKLSANAVTADKIAANSISANKLMISSRPFSVYGTRFWVDTIGYLQWSSGYVQYPSTDGGYRSEEVVAYTWGPDSRVIYIFYRPGRGRFDVTYDETVQNDSSVFFVGKWHSDKSGPILSAGVGTLINGDQVVTGSLNANRIIARSITADQIASNSITANEIATNTITANRLSVATRPFSVYQTRFWVDTNGVLQWTAGYVQYSSSDGGYRSEQIGGGSRAPGGVWYIFYSPGSSGFGLTQDETIQTDQTVFSVGKWHSDKSGPILAGGVGTLINGDQIVTGSVNANRIIARTITADHLAANSVTANEIAAGTITAAQIATSALTARVLAIGNPDNIIGDSGYNDASWWNGGNADGRLTVGESGMIETGRELKVTSSGRSDFYSMFFPVELGATYRVSVGVYTYGDFNGRFRPVIHMPNWAWLNLKAGTGVDPEDSNPSLNWTSASSYFRNEFVVTNPANTLECRRWQFRLIGDWAGTLAFACKIVRVSDTTLIKDGAITTDKITVNSLNGDRITAGTLNADRIIAGSVLSNQITVAGTSGNLGDAVERARDPAYRINNGVGTQISPGLINISGGTTLANWRQGGDDTRIAGGSISANTISANKLTIGNRAISFIGLNFEWNPANNSVSWSNGYIYYQDDNGSPRAQFVNGGDTGGANPHRFFYWMKDGGYIYHTQSEQEAFGGTDRVMLGSWWGESNLNMTYGGTIINGDRITTGSIDANRIKANTVLASTVVVSGRGTVDSAFDSAKWSNVTGNGKPADGATVGAPSGTMVGNTEAQTVTNWAYTGQQDPATRINNNTTTIDGGKITTGSLDANRIAAYTVLSNFVQIGGTGLGAGFDIGAIALSAYDPANRINNGTSTTISGGKITTGSIDANKLNVGSLSAISANIGDVTAGVVRNASGSAKFDLTAGRIVFDNGSVMKVSGNGFGSSNQFIEWFGPRKNNFSECTEQNANYYLKTDGSSYFGGSLSAGTIKNAIGTTSTANNANVSTGDVGSRGGSRVVVLSYNWSWTQSVDKTQNEASGSDLSAQIVLSRNGADVATLTASGNWERTPAASREEPGLYSETIGGSLTFTDNSGGSSVNYSARLTVRNTGPGPQNGSSRPGVASQRISIVQTEQ